MNFNTHKWKQVKLGDICTFEYGNSLKEQSRNGGNIPVYGSAGIVGWHDAALTKSPTLIVARKGSIGNIFYSEVPCFPIDTVYYVEETKTKENLNWLKLVLSHYDLKKLNMATAIPGINRNIVYQILVPLPCEKEQNQITELFQSIEATIKQSLQQIKSLKALRKSLTNSFLSDKPTFGNLLKDRLLKKVNYSNVTEKLMRKIDPITCGIERIVAGENLESEDFKIRTWGVVGKNFLGPAFHVLFKEKDILYGSRRTYLKKVALADFEGVCANTTYVIRADEKILLQDLLKYIMLSDKFTQYSISVSKGSTNPYINWKDLDNFSFLIPDLKIQNEIVSILDSIIDIVEQIKTQIQTLKNLKQKLLNEILG